MQDENIACRDLGKVLFEYAVGCFGTSQRTSQLERAIRFPNVPTRARDSFSSVQYYNLGRLVNSQAYCKHSCIATCYVFPHTTMMLVTLSWPNSKDGANANLWKLVCHAPCLHKKNLSLSYIICRKVKTGRQVSALTSAWRWAGIKQLIIPPNRWLSYFLSCNNSSWVLFLLNQHPSIHTKYFNVYLTCWMDNFIAKFLKYQSSSSNAVFFKKAGCRDPPWLPILSQSHEVFISHSRPFSDICHQLRSWPSSSYFPQQWTLQYQPVDVVTSHHVTNVG